MKCLLFIFLLAFLNCSVKAQNQWDGDNPIGDFLWADNWNPNTVPITWANDRDLLFENCTNVSQTSMYHNLGSWLLVRSIIYQTTFPKSSPLNTAGNGFDFWFKIQNESFYPQVITVPLSFYGTAMELNPINADLTLNSPIYNNNNRNYLVYGSTGKKLFLNNLLSGDVVTNLSIKQYSIVSIGYPNSTGAFGNGVNIETGELWFEAGASINGGIIKVGNGNSNVAKLYLNDADGGSELNNNITVPASSSQSYIGSLNTSGTNTYSGSLSLSAPVQLESFNGGTVNFSGDISGSFGVTIDDVIGSGGNATVQYSGTFKTYTGITTINNGATLRISSNQSLGAIVLNNGGKLIVDNGVTLIVNGAWTGGGEIVNNGTMRLIGPGAFPGTTSNVTAMNVLNSNKTVGILDLDNDLIITGSLVLTSATFNINAGKKLTLNGASQVNAGGALTGSTTSDFTVSGNTGGTVIIPAAITLRNVLVDGNRILQLNGTNNLSLNGLLSVTAAATFSNGGDASQVSNSGGTISVAGTFITMHPNGFNGSLSAVPTVPITLSAGSTVKFDRAGNQAISLSPDPGYKNITLSNSGIKTPSSAFNPAGTVLITGDAIFNCTASNVGDATTSLTMNGNSRLIVGTTGVRPSMAGTYNLTGGTVQFACNNSTSQSIRPETYQSIEVTGTFVKNGGGNITLRNNGVFTIKSNAVFEMSDNSIVGPSGVQSLIIENLGTFKCAVPLGFIGPADFPTSPAVRTDIEAISLQTGSLVEYSRSNPPLVDGNQVITNTHSYQNLTLSGTGTKTAPSTTLTVQGNLTKSGTSTFAHNNGLVILNGTNQNFAGLDYYGLEMTGSTKTTNGDASIANVLQVNNSTTLALQTGDSITLKSTAVKTARFGQLGTGASITYGNIATSKFVVERFIRSGRKWRYLSIPTDDANQTFKSAWQEGAATILQNPKPSYGTIIGDPGVNALANGFDLRTPTFPSLKTYVAASNSYVGIPATIQTIQTMGLGVHPGFFVFVQGDRTITAIGSTSSTTLRTAGKLFINDHIVSVAGTEVKGIGNPYASPVNMIAAINPSNAANGLVDAYQVWDPQGTNGIGFGNFQALIWDGTNFTVTPGGGSYGASLSIHNNIESGLAFFVKGDGGGTINFTEAAKNVAATSVSFTSGMPQILRGNLFVKPSNSEPVLIDGFMVNFDSSYANTVDGKDITKMINTGENAGLKKQDIKLIVERHAFVVNDDTLHMDMTNMRVQNYQWDIILDNMDYPGRSAFLIDRYLQSSTPLNMVDTTRVNFNIVNIAGSYAADRFLIVFKQADLGPVPVTITTVAATRKEDRTIDVIWKVENETNISNYEVQRSADGNNFAGIQNKAALANNGGRVTYNHIDFIPLPTDNFYRIKATTINGSLQYSAIVKVSALKQSSNISVYPNPVVDGNVQVLFNGQPRGKYKLQLSNAAGQVMFQGNIIVNSAVQSQNILLPAGTTSGSYQLGVIAADGTVTLLQVLLK